MPLNKENKESENSRRKISDKQKQQNPAWCFCPNLIENCAQTNDLT